MVSADHAFDALSNRCSIELNSQMFPALAHSVTSTRSI
jgi:hypothetical protein